MKVYLKNSLALLVCVAWAQADVTISLFNQGAVESDGVGDSQTFSYQSTKVKADLLQQRFAMQDNRDFSFYKIYADYSYTRLEWEPEQFELENYGLGLTLGEINNGKGRWSYLANVHTALRQQRGLSADFGNLRTTGFILGTYEVKQPWLGDSLAWSLGFAYLDMKDGEGVIPVAGFKWQVNPHWLLQSKSTTISSHYSTCNVWTWKSIIERKHHVWDLNQGELHWTAYHVGTGFTYQASDKLTTELLAGMSIGAEAEIEGAGAASRARDTDAGIWATLSLKYNY